MTERDKKQKTVTLSDKDIAYIENKSEENGTTFTREIEKSINLRKAGEKREHGLESFNTSMKRSQLYWMREILYVLEDIRDELKSR